MMDYWASSVVHHLPFKVGDIQEEPGKLESKGITFIRGPFSRTPGLQLEFFYGPNNVNLLLFDDRR